MPTITLGLFVIISSRVTTAFPNRLSKVLGRNSMNSMPRFSSSATAVSHDIQPAMSPRFSASKAGAPVPVATNLTSLVRSRPASLKMSST